MPKFLGPLQLEAVGKDEWKLLKPLTYVSQVYGIYREVSVPTGFVNDLASIPRVLQSVVPKIGKHRRAAVLHDYLYSLKGDLPHMKISRAQADKMFLEAMKADGVRYTRRYVMYWGVRAGGWVYWNRK